MFPRTNAPELTHSALRSIVTAMIARLFAQSA
jgi:hypothetical protein